MGWKCTGQENQMFEWKLLYELQSEALMTINLFGILKCPHIVNSSVARFYATIFFLSSLYNVKHLGQQAGQLFC